MSRVEGLVPPMPDFTLFYQAYGLSSQNRITNPHRCFKNFINPHHAGLYQMGVISRF